MGFGAVRGWEVQRHWQGPGWLSVVGDTLRVAPGPPWSPCRCPFPSTHPDPAAPTVPGSSLPSYCRCWGLPPNLTLAPTSLASHHRDFLALRFPLGTVITAVIRKTITRAEWKQLNLFPLLSAGLTPRPPTGAGRAPGTRLAGEPCAAVGPDPRLCPVPRVYPGGGHRALRRHPPGWGAGEWGGPGVGEGDEVGAKGQGGNRWSITAPLDLPSTAVVTGRRGGTRGSAPCVAPATWDASPTGRECGRKGRRDMSPARCLRSLSPAPAVPWRAVPRPSRADVWHRSGRFPCPGMALPCSLPVVRLAPTSPCPSSSPVRPQGAVGRCWRCHPAHTAARGSPRATLGQPPRPTGPPSWRAVARALPGRSGPARVRLVTCTAGIIWAQAPAPLPPPSLRTLNPSSPHPRPRPSCPGHHGAAAWPPLPPRSSAPPRHKVQPGPTRGWKRGDGDG